MQNFIDLLSGVWNQGLLGVSISQIIISLIILVLGLFYPYLKKIGLGQLPGDIIYKSDNSTFFFPIVTCIIVSIVLTVIFNLFK